MRAFLAIVIIALLMGLAGWITIGTSSTKTTINVETEEIKRDTENAAENAEQMIKSGAKSITHDSPTYDSSVRD